MTPIQDIIAKHNRPLEPIPTDHPPRLKPLGDVQAVLFDIYGTLFVSGSGDIGVAQKVAKHEAFNASLAAIGVDASNVGEAGPERLLEMIHKSHEESRKSGIEYPEVVIEDIWAATIASLVEEGLLDTSANDADMQQLAVYYEVRTNPVWPMPDLVVTLDGLSAAGITLGIISNAQFFTPELFPALLGRTLDDLGFDRDLCFYSFSAGEAKPGQGMYRRAAEQLARRDIAPANTLYVGNDMLNDIAPAAALGFHTALFAGDARSLRMREGDARVADTRSDVVITNLASLHKRVGGDM